GIVEPMSLAAFTHSVSCGVDVAVAAGLDEVVFSTGRSSERVVERELKLPEAAYVLTGDHMGHALRDAGGRKGLRRVTVAGQFGKFTKLAAGHFETHCSDSSVEFGFIAGLCREYGAKDRLIKRVEGANTAREVFFMLKAEGLGLILKKVCAKVRENSEGAVGKRLEVRSVLVGYDDELACVCGAADETSIGQEAPEISER
ncbi:MAG: cobalt-precorrin-5B (C(1))-methyltransferase, partial [Deltaproteobacteria bacterium]